MSLDRHGCKLQPDWLAEAYHRGAVIPVSSFIGYESILSLLTYFFLIVSCSL